MINQRSPRKDYLGLQLLPGTVMPFRGQFLFFFSTGPICQFKHDFTLSACTGLREITYADEKDPCRSLHGIYVIAVTSTL